MISNSLYNQKTMKNSLKNNILIKTILSIILAYFVILLISFITIRFSHLTFENKITLSDIGTFILPILLGIIIPLNINIWLNRRKNFYDMLNIKLNNLLNFIDEMHYNYTKKNLKSDFFQTDYNNIRITQQIIDNIFDKLEFGDDSKQLFKKIKDLIRQYSLLIDDSLNIQPQNFSEMKIFKLYAEINLKINTLEIDLKKS